MRAEEGPVHLTHSLLTVVSDVLQAWYARKHVWVDVKLFGNTSWRHIVDISGPPFCFVVCAFSVVDGAVTAVLRCCSRVCFLVLVQYASSVHRVVILKRIWYGGFAVYSWPSNCGPSYIFFYSLFFFVTQATSGPRKPVNTCLFLGTCADVPVLGTSMNKTVWALHDGRGNTQRSFPDHNLIDTLDTGH